MSSLERGIKSPTISKIEELASVRQASAYFAIVSLPSTVSRLPTDLKAVGRLSPLKTVTIRFL